MARKKNRKKQASQMIFPLPFAALLGAAAVMSLFYLWINGRCDDLGNRIKQLENQKTEIHKRIINEEYKLANMKSPRNMELLLKRHNIQMSWPGDDRVVRLSYRQTPAYAQDERQMFVQNIGSTRHD
jgi:hypothetical protein